MRVCDVYSVIFAGFSSDALRDRIVDAKSKVRRRDDDLLPLGLVGSVSK